MNSFSLDEIVENMEIGERSTQEMLESSGRGAANFHKLTGVTENQRAFDRAFMDKYVDPANNRIYPSKVRHRRCPLCSESEGKLLFIKNGFRHLLCECKMIYVPEILSNDFNLAYSGFDQEKMTHDSFRNPHRAMFNRSVYESGVDFLAKYGVKEGKLLDIGCSSGLFLEYAISRSFDAIGVEPSTYAAKIATENGLNVVCSTYSSDLFPENSFDIVTLWDVLEHVENPLLFLRQVSRTLKPGGTLFLQVPNVTSLAATILRDECNMFNGYGHINLFSPKTAHALINRAGLKSPSMKTIISEFSALENYLNFEDPYLGSSSGCQKFFGLLSEAAVHQKLMGYKLQLAATSVVSQKYCIK